MTRHVCIIQGHPDGPAREGEAPHYCHALADAYARGAEAAGAEVSRLDVSALHPDPLDTVAAYDEAPAGAMEKAREAVAAADHLVIVFPLWLGGMPARLKAFFEQLARAEFVLGKSDGGWPEQKLKGRSAHVIVTMGMPAIAYRVWFLNAGVSVLKRMVLGLAGVSPVRQTTIGGADGLSDAARRRHIERIERAGRNLR